LEVLRVEAGGEVLLKREYELVEGTREFGINERNERKVRNCVTERTEVRKVGERLE
jgi:hypothetical protein